MNYTQDWYGWPPTLSLFPNTKARFGIFPSVRPRVDCENTWILKMRRGSVLASGFCCCCCCSLFTFTNLFGCTHHRKALPRNHHPSNCFISTSLLSHRSYSLNPSTCRIATVRLDHRSGQPWPVSVGVVLSCCSWDFSRCLFARNVI